MKKFIALGASVLVVLVIGLIVTIVLSINPIIEKAVNTFGPKITDTEVHLGSANVSFLSGAGSLSDLFVGNPKGFSAPSAMELGDISISVDKNSLTTDTIIINKIVITKPKLTYETKGKTNNIQTLLDNVKKNASSGDSGSSSASKGESSAESADSGSSKKLVINELLITGGEINLVMSMLGTQSVTVPMGDIRMTDIGRDKKADPAEVFAKILGAVNKDVMGSVSSGLKDLGGTLTDGAKDAGEAVGSATKDLGSKIKGIFD